LYQQINFAHLDSTVTFDSSATPVPHAQISSKAPSSTNSRVRQWGGVGIKSHGTVYVGKMNFLVQKSYGGSYGEFSEPGFPHNCAKNDRQELKMGCIDASRRQLQSVLKIGF
jgi:hypothetical protein